MIKNNIKEKQGRSSPCFLLHFLNIDIRDNRIDLAFVTKRADIFFAHFIAVAKQKALIERFHAAGAEVLMSSHTHTHLSEDEAVAYAKAQRERGADVCKIVNFSNTEDEEQENIRAILRIKKEVGGKFLFLANGEYCHTIRQIGTSLGVCMWLCVQKAVREQPQLRAMKQVQDNLFYNC